MSELETTSGTNSATPDSSSPSARQQPGRREGLDPDAINAAVAKMLEEGRQRNEQAKEKGQDDTGDGGTGPERGLLGDAGDEEAGAEDAKGAAQGAAAKDETEADAPGVTAKERLRALGDDATLVETARALKVAAKDLYKMQIPLGDGSDRHLSLEDLKQRYLAGEAGRLDGEAHEINRQKAVFEAQRVEHDKALVSAKQEINDIVSLIQAVAPDGQAEQLLSRTREVANETRRREASKLLETMPEFRDKTVYQAWQDESVNFLRGYGFSEAEALNINDHRHYRVLNDFMKLSKRLAALEDVKGDPIEPPKAVKRRRAGVAQNSRTKGLVEKAKKTGTEKDRTAAIAALIGGQ